MALMKSFSTSQGKTRAWICSQQYHKALGCIAGFEEWSSHDSIDIDWSQEDEFAYTILLKIADRHIW